MKATLYWKEIIWIVEDDLGKHYKVLISESEPGHEHVKVTDADGSEITGIQAERYVEVARKKGI